MTPTHGEMEQCGGGTIVFDAPLRKFAVFDSAGHLHGFRGSIERARELACNIPSATTWAPPPPPELSRSPRAMAPAPEAGVPGGLARDQHPMRDPPPRAVDAYTRGKSMTRRHHQR
jgi:hypothetical protein